MKIRFAIAVIATAMLAAGCRSNSMDEVLATDATQVQLRAMQSRSFETGDQGLTVRNVISTMQDLGFVVDKVDDALGTVSGTKMQDYVMRMTVTIRPTGKKLMQVRASAQYNLTAVSDPQPYQQFFAALEKAMFLRANQVD
jgi:PBP1b-binding outer membrane lipoprotein LpoB